MRDLDALTSWHAHWRGLRVAVLGLGLTGFAVADTLVELGARVRVLASGDDADRERLLEVIGAEFARDNLEASIAEFDPDLVVTSPGFRPNHPLLLWAAGHGVTVWGDIELAWRVRDKVKAAEWITVTGTLGKSTTAELAAHLIAAAGHRVAAVGNIGVPVLDAVREPTGFDVLVVELSSAQLHWMNSTIAGSVSPLASVCLNHRAGHHHWHGSAASYAAAHAKVYDNTRVACIYNKSDAATLHMVEEAEVVDGARAIGFDLGTPGPSDLGMVGDIIVDRAFHDDRHASALELTTHGELAGIGMAEPHGVANVLAASALARAFGVPAATVGTAIASFRRHPGSN